MNIIRKWWVIPEIKVVSQFWNHNGYIDAVVEYAEKNGLEIEVVGQIIRKSPLLKANIYKEAEELNMVEKLVRLPV